MDAGTPICYEWYDHWQMATLPKESTEAKHIQESESFNKLSMSRRKHRVKLRRNCSRKACWRWRIKYPWKQKQRKQGVGGRVFNWKFN